MRLHFNVDIHDTATYLITTGIILADGALKLNEVIKNEY